MRSKRIYVAGQRVWPKTATCRTCEKTFSYLSHSQGKYCSRECFYVSLKGRKKSKEWKRRIGKSNRGIKRPYSAANLPHGFGKNNPFWGRKHTEETKAKLRAARLKQRFNKVSQIELRLREALQKANIAFEAQKRLGNVCIVDIFIEPDLAVFCDGDYWHNLDSYKKRDKRQDRLLKADGYRVLRFWEHEINENLAQCLAQIEVNVGGR